MAALDVLRSRLDMLLKHLDQFDDLLRAPIRLFYEIKNSSVILNFLELKQRALVIKFLRVNQKDVCDFLSDLLILEVNKVKENLKIVLVKQLW